MQDTLLPLNQALETQQDVAVPSSKKAIRCSEASQFVHLSSHRPEPPEPCWEEGL